jgi:acyl carrier protein
MSRFDFLRNLDGLLNVPSGTLQGNEPLETLSGWDSLAIVGFLALMDKEFGVNVSTKQLGQCRNVNDLTLLAGDRLRP